MAQFPSAVKTFTTKNAGDVIQPSHIGDLQDEVTAIEDGILNGTAPINSSRITAPSLQVTVSTVTNLTATNSTLTNLSATNSTIATLKVSSLLRVATSSKTVPSGESTALDLSNASMWLLASTGASTGVISTISGITVGQTGGELLWLNNNGSPTLNIAHTGSSAAAINRIVTPNGATVQLQTHEGVQLVHDGTNWRVFGMGQST